MDNHVIDNRIRIDVELPHNRENLGTLTVSANGRTLGTFKVLGKADNGRAAASKDKNGNPKTPNPGANPLLPYGYTPTGFYNVPVALPSGAGTSHPASSFGPNGVLALEPTGGQAKEAKANNRKGFLIHAGPPNSLGQLRRTNGCLRVSNDDMASLLQLLDEASIAGGTAPYCAVKEVQVQVAEKGGADDGYNEGDPPFDSDDPLWGLIKQAQLQSPPPVSAFNPMGRTTPLNPTNPQAPQGPTDQPPRRPTGPEWPTGGVPGGGGTGHPQPAGPQPTGPHGAGGQHDHGHHGNTPPRGPQQPNVPIHGPRRVVQDRDPQ